jgi:hypothetical protein
LPFIYDSFVVDLSALAQRDVDRSLARWAGMEETRPNGSEIASPWKIGSSGIVAAPIMAAPSAGSA